MISAMQNVKRTESAYNISQQRLFRTSACESVLPAEKRFLDEVDQLFFRERLLDVVHGTVLHAIDGGLDCGETGDFHILDNITNEVGQLLLTRIDPRKG